MPASKIDSNIVGLSFCEEDSLKVVSGDEKWYAMEPNSFSDFGASITTVAREPISASRQNKKGTVTDIEAKGGFNIDLTQNNLTRLMQGFFFADAREKVSTCPINGNQIAISAVASGTKTITLASGGAAFLAGRIVKLSGMTDSTNNKKITVASSTATTIVANETLNTEVSTATAVARVVGIKFPAADVSMALGVASAALTTVAGDFNGLGLTVGEWVYLGSDDPTSRFSLNCGYGRIKAISAKVLDLEETTFTPTVEPGTGKTIELYFGTFIKNETGSLIKRRSYQFERTLGNDGVDASIQAEYVTGAIANEVTINIPESNKVTVDMSFVGMDSEFKTSAEGPKGGTRIAAAGEDALNTAKNIYRSKLFIYDPNIANAVPLFAYVTDAKLTINNGVNLNKALGVLGGFDASTGNFVAGGSLTAYFTTVNAIKAVKNNANVGYNVIFANKNAGMVYDIPNLSIGGGIVNVEKDAAIKLPIDMNGCEGLNGYSMSYTNFSYLPTQAIPQ